MNSLLNFAIDTIAEEYQTSEAEVLKALEPLKPKPLVDVIQKSINVIGPDGKQVPNGAEVDALYIMRSRIYITGPRNTLLATKSYINGLTNEPVPSLRGKEWSLNQDGEFDYKGIFFWFGQPGDPIKTYRTDYYTTNNGGGSFEFLGSFSVLMRPLPGK